MKRIPRAFMLAGHRFTVEYVSEKEMEEAAGQPAYGLFLPNRLSILLLHPSRRLKRSVILQTFYHELFHAIFWVANHQWQNEKLVDQCGHLLHQAITSSEFK